MHSSPKRPKQKSKVPTDSMSTLTRFRLVFLRKIKTTIRRKQTSTTSKNHLQKTKCAHLVPLADNSHQEVAMDRLQTVDKQTSTVLHLWRKPEESIHRTPAKRTLIQFSRLLPYQCKSTHQHFLARNQEAKRLLQM